MVIKVPLRRIIKKVKILSIVILLIVMVFYVLPKLLILLWDAGEIDSKDHDYRLLEKPLRVEKFTEKELSFDNRVKGKIFFC